MKKIMIHIIALSLLLAVLSGCNSTPVSHTYTSVDMDGEPAGQVELTVAEGSGYKQKVLDYASVQITRGGKVYLDGGFVEDYAWTASKDFYVTTQVMNGPNGLDDFLDDSFTTDTDEYNLYTDSGDEYVIMPDGNNDVYLVKIGDSNLYALFTTTMSEEEATEALNTLTFKLL